VEKYRTRRFIEFQPSSSDDPVPMQGTAKAIPTEAAGHTRSHGNNLKNPAGGRPPKPHKARLGGRTQIENGRSPPLIISSVFCLPSFQISSYKRSKLKSISKSKGRVNITVTGTLTDRGLSTPATDRLNSTSHPSRELFSGFEANTSSLN
jgi:hypothetical protein